MAGKNRRRGHRECCRAPGSVVLTRSAGLTSEAEGQLRRLGVRSVYLMGGESAVGARLMEALEAMLR